MERKMELPKDATRVSQGAVRAMACVQGDKKITAVGKNIMIRVEQTGGKTDSGLHLPDSAATQRLFVESIGSNVDVANEDGKKLEIGDEILAMKMSMVPVFDTLKQESKNIMMLGENDVIAIVEEE